MIYMHLLTSFATNNGFITLVEWEGGPVSASYSVRFPPVKWNKGGGENEFLDWYANQSSFTEWNGAICQSEMNLVSLGDA